MWCAIRIASSDGRALWLTDANSQGVRTVGKFENTAIFWRREHAQVAVEAFLRRSRRKIDQLTIVDVAQELLGKT
jgi:hypothetical protein